MAGMEMDAIGDVDFVFIGGAIRRGEIFLPPQLDGDIEGLHNGGPPNGPDDQDVQHPVPEPLVAGDPAAGNGDEAAAVNEQIQQREHEDLQAVRKVLRLPIRGNAIDAAYLFKVLKSLRAILPKEGPYRIPYFQAEYARILERMARVITILYRENYEMVHCNRHLGYDAMFQLLQETIPGCPLEYGECLDRLCEHMTAAASMMQSVDGVFVLWDREEFACSLRSLAALLLLPNL